MLARAQVCNDVRLLTYIESGIDHRSEYSYDDSILNEIGSDSLPCFCVCISVAPEN